MAKEVQGEAHVSVLATRRGAAVEIRRHMSMTTRGRKMRALLHWLTRDDVARTNAAQASVRLRHRRHVRDDIDTYPAGRQPTEDGSMGVGQDDPSDE